jgi:hypothetical protein
MSCLKFREYVIRRNRRGPAGYEILVSPDSFSDPSLLSLIYRRIGQARQKLLRQRCAGFLRKLESFGSDLFQSSSHAVDSTLAV